jgi:hypothetical protein
MRRLLVLSICFALFGTLALPVSAASGTGPPPIPTCGPPAGAPGPCTETDHFSTEGPPFPVFIACPPDFGFYLLSADGNGVQHITVNSAQDGWFTSTFEGTASLDPILVSIDRTTKPPTVTVLGPDPLRSGITGHIALWFGGSFNNQNYVLHDTGNFKGSTVTSPSRSVDLHFIDHANSVPPNNLPPPFGPPTNAKNLFSMMSC